MNTTKSILHNNSKEEWLNRWATGTTGRAMYREMSKPNSKDNINRLCRKDQCIIFQLRTGHVRLKKHLNRTNPLHPPLCRNCPAPYETVKYVMLECPGLQHLRRELLPTIPSLYGNVTQMINTCRFIHLALSQE